LPGQRILDPFCGSCSTPAAAVKLGRLISGIELRQQWAKITQQRICVE
jgi:site-specific DNA-methyltransferase (adenine-specific)/modification methylase